MIMENLHCANDSKALSYREKRLQLTATGETFRQLQLIFTT